MNRRDALKAMQAKAPAGYRYVKEVDAFINVWKESEFGWCVKALRTDLKPITAAAFLPNRHAARAFAVQKIKERQKAKAAKTVLCFQGEEHELKEIT